MSTTPSEFQFEENGHFEVTCGLDTLELFLIKNLWMLTRALEKSRIVVLAARVRQFNYDDNDGGVNIHLKYAIFVCVMN